MIEFEGQIQMKHSVAVSALDIHILSLIRANVVSFMQHCSAAYAKSSGILLDIAPQEHEGARPFFADYVSVKTLDIDSRSGCDFVADICSYNECIFDRSFDYVVCTEVLEHTLNPFEAVREILRILKPGGYLFGSTPFNFRIHGPLPDCWRFTEHGLRALLKEFEIVELNQVDTPERSLMPIHYTFVAKRSETAMDESSRPSTLTR
jgi:SAM-dependent methyltransferase